MAKRKARKRKTATKTDSLRSKITTSWKNLVLFIVLFVFSLLLYNVSSSPLFLNLFAVFSILFGFVVFALLLVLIVLLIIRASRR